MHRNDFIAIASVLYRIGSIDKSGYNLMRTDIPQSIQNAKKQAAALQEEGVAPWHIDGTDNQGPAIPEEP